MTIDKYMELLHNCGEFLEDIGGLVDDYRQGLKDDEKLREAFLMLHEYLQKIGYWSNFYEESELLEFDPDEFIYLLTSYLLTVQHLLHSPNYFDPIKDAKLKEDVNKIRNKPGPKPKTKKGVLTLLEMSFLYGTLVKVGAFPETSKIKAQDVFFELTGYSGNRKLFKNENMPNKDREGIKKVLRDALDKLNDENFSGWED